MLGNRAGAQLVFTDVCGRLAKPCRTIFECTKAHIAALAQQLANSTCCMIVIDVRLQSTLQRSTSDIFSADGTFTVLSTKEMFKGLKRETVIPV